jgi:hypothetical protein
MRMGMQNNAFVDFFDCIDKEYGTLMTVFCAVISGPFFLNPQRIFARD